MAIADTKLFAHMSTLFALLQQCLQIRTIRRKMVEIMARQDLCTFVITLTYMCHHS
jgi:hypothetical protein